MDLITVMRKFPDQQACMAYLETVRWGDHPVCPHCNGDQVGRKVDGDRIGRWNCHSCSISFNVLSDTIFSRTKIPLQKWFLAIALILNAKKSISSHQLARDLDLNQKSAWYMKMRIRDNMVEDREGFLYGIVEADETFVGGKPRGHRKHRQKAATDQQDDESEQPKRGRGTKKLPVIGAVARGGRVMAQPSPKVTAKTLKDFLSRHVNPEDSVLVTDEFPAYRPMGQWVPHFTINHAVRYVEGLIHTNTIEGFWSLVKRAVYGTHHHYSREHAAAYIVESCYKYNVRNNPDQFGDFMRGAMAA